MNEAAQEIREFGATLRRTREGRGLTVEAAATMCMLSDEQIIGLESANYRAFYSHAYARRAARRYAAILEVPTVPDIEKIGQEAYRAPAGLQHLQHLMHLTQPSRRPRGALRRTLAVAFVALSAALFVAAAANELRPGQVQCSSPQLVWRTSLETPSRTNPKCGAGPAAGAVSPLARAQSCRDAH